MDKPKYVLARAQTNLILSPGEEIKFSLPEELRMEEYVLVTPRIASLKWLKPSIMQPAAGTIYLINSSTADITVHHGDHLADVRGTQPHGSSPGIYNMFQYDKFQYEDFSTGRDSNPEYLAQIQVDPDNVLSEEDRSIFHNLHKRFASLFTKQPGRYNGKWGFVENRLQFSTPPPPNSRTHIPNYSPSMNAILAEKMDLLESWGS